MKSLLLAFALLATTITDSYRFAASAPPAGIAEVGSGSQRAISNTTTPNQDSKATAFPGNVTSGNLIVVGGNIWTSGNTTVAPAVTDSRGNTYTVKFDATTMPAAGVAWNTFIAYAVNSGTGACTVTVNPSGSSSDFCYGIDEFSGVTQLDVDANPMAEAHPSAGPAQETFSTVAADTLILAVIGTDSGVSTTPLTNYTQIAESESGSNNQPMNFQFRIVSSAGSYTPGCTLGASDTWGCQALSLKP